MASTRAISPSSPIRSRAVPLLALVLCAPLPACQGSESACQREPTGQVVAFRVTQDLGRSHSFEGVLSRVHPPNDLGLRRLTIRAGVDADIEMVLGGTGDPLPLTVGATYRWQVDHVGGFPDASGILVWDDQGLVLAAASDRAPGSLVLTDGVPGFRIELLPARCGSRPHDACYSSLRNAPLLVEHGARSAQLYHGETAELAGYRVTCLTAQEVEYTDQCDDAGLVALSYVIERIERDEENGTTR